MTSCGPFFLMSDYDSIEIWINDLLVWLFLFTDEAFSPVSGLS